MPKTKTFARFSLRAFLIATTAVGIAIGIFAQRSRGQRFQIHAQAVDHLIDEVGLEIPEIEHRKRRALRALASGKEAILGLLFACLLYTSPSPRDATLSRMPSSA